MTADDSKIDEQENAKATKDFLQSNIDDIDKQNELAVEKIEDKEPEFSEGMMIFTNLIQLTLLGKSSF